MPVPIVNIKDKEEPVPAGVPNNEACLTYQMMLTKQ